MDHTRVILGPDDSAPDAPTPDAVDFRVANQLGRRNPIAEIETCCWPGCPADRYDASDAPPFCGNHMVRCAVYISASVTDLLDADASARSKVTPLLPDLAGPRTLTDAVVYYVRLGNHIKIGTTTNLAARLNALYVDHDPELLLATEPGGRDVESLRHHEFDQERVYANRELFNPSRRLLEHIESLRDGQKP